MRAVQAKRARREAAMANQATANRGEVVGQVDAADLAEYREVFAAHRAAADALTKAQERFVETRGAAQYVGEKIANKHQMGPSDSMDLETGQITRKQANG